MICRKRMNITRNSMLKNTLVFAMLVGCVLTISAKSNAASAAKNTKVKVVIDNDFCGDPDGLFQLAHQLLCKTTDIRAIVGGHLAQNAGFTNRKDQATESCEKANKVLDLMGMTGKIKVVSGSETALASTNIPAESEGAGTIVEEARKCTPDKP